MAKTIKFNLILDGYSVRNIEEVREHFSVEDMLKYYGSGLLQRWLKVRGYEKELAAIEKIEPQAGNKEVVFELIEAFDMADISKDQVEESVAILEFTDDERVRNALYAEDAISKKEIIADYHSTYRKIVDYMIEHKKSMPLLKAAALQMERECLGLFELDQSRLFGLLYNRAPMAIYAMLMIDSFRNIWLNDDYNDLYRSELNNIASAYMGKEILGDYIRIVTRDTQAMWDPIERSEVTVMVIAIGNGTFIKNAGEFHEKLSITDVNGKLLKMNGLEYQCNDARKELLYIEV